MSSSPVAAIDIGTNSVLLTIAQDLTEPLVERAEITRLGEDCDKNGYLLPEAIDRTLRSIKGYAALIANAGVTQLSVVATSATRDAENGGEFRDQIANITGFEPEIISGEREAELTFAGACCGLSLQDEELCVCDIGGGSTEIIRGRLTESGPQLAEGASLDVGSVRLTERFVAADPPSRAMLEQIRGCVQEELRSLGTHGPARFVGVAGTVTTLSAIWNQVEPYDPKRIHGSTLSIEVVRQLRDDLAALPLPSRQVLPGLDPRRADVIPAGATILETVMTWAGATSCTVSDRGVRWGLVAELLGE